MRLCAMCRRREVSGRTSSYCRPCHRDYCRAWRGPSRVDKHTKAMAWLKAAPRTSRQIADLLNITPNHAATLLRRLRLRGLIEPIGPPPDSRGNRYQVRRAL